MPLPLSSRWTPLWRFHTAALLLGCFTLFLAIDGSARHWVTSDPRRLVGVVLLVVLVGWLEATSRRTLVGAALEDDRLLVRLLGTQRSVPLRAIYVVGRTALRIGGATVRAVEVQVPWDESGRPQTLHFLPRTDRSEGLLTLAVARAVQPPSTAAPHAPPRPSGPSDRLGAPRRRSRQGV
jgi:hypothetical protein